MTFGDIPVLTETPLLTWIFITHDATKTGWAGRGNVEHLIRSQMLGRAPDF
jgi:hypothetical protein